MIPFRIDDIFIGFYEWRGCLVSAAALGLLRMLYRLNTYKDGLRVELLEGFRRCRLH